MRQIRNSVFETNSSSTHSITMCMKKDYEAWEIGEMVFDTDTQKLVPITDEIRAELDMYARENYDVWDMRYLTYDDYDRYCEEYEGFSDELTLPDDEKVVAFGYYGYGG